MGKKHENLDITTPTCPNFAKFWTWHWLYVQNLL